MCTPQFDLTYRIGGTRVEQMLTETHQKNTHTTTHRLTKLVITFYSDQHQTPSARVPIQQCPSITFMHHRISSAWVLPAHTIFTHSSIVVIALYPIHQSCSCVSTNNPLAMRISLKSNHHKYIIDLSLSTTDLYQKGLTSNVFHISDHGLHIPCLHTSNFKRNELH